MNAGHPNVGTPIGATVGHWSFDEGYGTTAHDKSPQGNNGTITGASWTNDGKFGKALNFDGSSDYVNLGDLDSLEVGNMGGNITISAWVNPSSFGTEKEIIRKEGQGGYALRFRNDGVISYWLWNSTGWANIEGPILEAGSWTHVVGTYDGSSMYLYIDGVQVDDLAGPFTTTGASTYPLVIGASSTFTSVFTGLIDEVKIYPFALTSDQVKVEYNQGKQIVLGSTSTGIGGTAPSWSASREYCVPGDTSTCNPPVGEWRLDEGSGTSVYDTSGNGNTGTLGAGSSAPAWTTGKIGKGLKMDGDNDYVNIPYNSLYRNNAITVTTWVKRTGTITNAHYSLVGEYLGVATDWTLEIPTSEGGFTSDRIVFTWYSPPTAGYSNWQGIETTSAASTLLPLNQWVKITATRPSSGLPNGTLMYINGSRVDTNAFGSAAPLNTAVNPRPIGGDSAGNSFPGEFDQVRIYNYARTPAQIAWEYNKGKPIAHYQFDECTGTTVYNFALNGNGQAAGMNGTITEPGGGTNIGVGTCDGSAGTMWADGVNGKFNGSLDFDGTDDYVSVADTGTSPLDLTNNLTISAWVYLNSYREGNDYLSGIVGKYSAGTGNTGYDFRIGNGLYVDRKKLNFAFTYGGGSWQSPVGDKEIPLGEWTHVAVTYDVSAAQQRFYVNGVLDNETSYSNTILTNNASLNIGTSNDGDGARSINGKIDDVRIYNYALTAAQVKDVYNNGAVSFK